MANLIKIEISTERRIIAKEVGKQLAELCKQYNCNLSELTDTIGLAIIGQYARDYEETLNSPIQY